jgi:hypothetical protein
MGMLGSSLLTAEAKVNAGDSVALGKLVKTFKKGNLVCKTYQNGNLTSTRCESKAAAEIPANAKLIKKFKKGDADCETR